MELIGAFTDPSDGKTYKTAKIGEQVWMAENLNYWALGSVCYGNELAFCKKFGRLYNWETAKKSCPVGWHLPSDEDWNILIATVGGNETAGRKLAATSGWMQCADINKGIIFLCNGTDDYGFAALPGGYNNSDGDRGRFGGSGFWWSSSDSDAYTANNLEILYNFDSAYLNGWNKAVLLSVRCLQY